MKNNGYTLMEVLIVLTVLSIIVLVSYPLMTNTLRTAEEQRYEEFINTIHLVTEAYIELNDEKYNLEEPFDSVIIKVDDLVNAGLYIASTQNPKTGEPLDLNDEILVYLQANYVKKFVYPIDGYEIPTP